MKQLNKELAISMKGKGREKVKNHRHLNDSITLIKRFYIFKNFSELCNAAPDTHRLCSYGKM